MWMGNPIRNFGNWSVHWWERVECDRECHRGEGGGRRGETGGRRGGWGGEEAEEEAESTVPPSSAPSICKKITTSIMGVAGSPGQARREFFPHLRFFLTLPFPEPWAFFYCLAILKVLLQTFLATDLPLINDIFSREIMRTLRTYFLWKMWYSAI